MKSDLVRLHHMFDAAEKAIAFSKGRDRKAFETDEMLSLAIVRLLEIVGEAAKQVSPEVRELESELPWKQIAGTRDRLIHGYFDVDLDIVWGIVSQDLPFLLEGLQRLLKKLEALEPPSEQC